GDQLLVFEHAEHVCLRVDLNGNISGRAGICAWNWSSRFRLIFNLIRSLRTGLAAGLNIFHRSEFEWLDVRHGQLVARFDAFQLSWIKLFKKMNVAVKFFGNTVGGIAVREKF